MDLIINYISILLFVSFAIVFFVDYVVREKIVEPMLKKYRYMDESENFIYLRKVHIEKYKELCELNGFKPKYYKFLTKYKQIYAISVLSIWIFIFIIDEFIF